MSGSFTDLYSKIFHDDAHIDLDEDIEIKLFERIEKRRRLNTNKEAIVYVETERDQSNVTVMIPDEERGYVAHFKSADETSVYIPIICRMYSARQVFVEMNGFGIAVYDSLRKRIDEVKNIYVVPIYNRAMRLD